MLVLFIVEHFQQSCTKLSNMLCYFQILFVWLKIVFTYLLNNLQYFRNLLRFHGYGISLENILIDIA